LNLIELHENNKRVAKWRGTGYSQNGNWTLQQAIPYVGTKTILYALSCHGETVEGIHYVYLQFTNVKFFNEKDVPENGDVRKIKYRGEDYWYILPTLESDVKLKCTCADYTYTFSFWNFKNKCQFGGPPKVYKKKTNRKPRNPLKLPGFCKHVFQSQAFLHQEGLLN
jgi:hypothetical protein